LVEAMMRAIKVDTTIAVLIGVFCVTAGSAFAQQQQQLQPQSQPQPQQAAYPAGKAVEMTVMFGAGSAADVTARYLADGMARRLNVPVPVVNRTGGGGAIGYSHVQKQRPDGYSIIWNSNSISTTYHSGTLPFDYKAFEAVARVSVETPVIVVRADSPWMTLKDLVEYAKANPGKVRIGNSGTSSHTHFSASALFAIGEANVTHVPFTEGQAVVNLLGSRIEGIVQLPAAVVPHVKSGDLRVLAVLGAKRDPIFPDIVTATEAGYTVALDMWRGVAAPKGTSKAIVAKLQNSIKQTVESQPFADAGKAIGFTPAYLSSDDFGKLIARDDAKLAQVMTELGLKKK
jgi:tripartite-type tricarboxylate transporter receptor subunit TctC